MKEVILLDSNLLLLLMVGSVSLKHIKNHKRLKDTYTEDDYKLLQHVLQSASDIRVTPNTLTETINLLRHIANPARLEIMLAIQQMINFFSEQYIPSLKASNRSEFPKLGLTDVVLLEAIHSNSELLLLTVDLDLAVMAESNGYKVINFNHLRDM